MKRMRMRVASLLAVMVLFAVGAGNVTAGQPGPLEDTTAEVVYFHHRAKAMYLGFAFSVVTLKEPDVTAIIAAETSAAGGDAVRNLRIERRTSFLDGVVSLMTFMVCKRQTVTVEGEVVRLPSKEVGRRAVNP